MSRLPPLNSIRAFEAAGRHLSFSKAADELNVTPGAISQQIKNLEEFFDRPLFIRLPRNLQLSDKGKTLLPFASAALDQLNQGVYLTTKNSERAILNVSVTRSFGSKWLVPRLESFYAEYPGIDIRLDASDRLVDFDVDGIDLAVRYGTGRYRGLEAERLVDNFIHPVCSPKLLQGERGIRTPEDLINHTLLHMEWKSESDAAPHWQTWLQATGVSVNDPEAGPRFSNEVMALQAAIEGIGVLLANNPLSANDIENGTLVRPFGDMQTANNITYYLVYPKRNLKDPNVRKFCQWMRKMMT